MYTIPHWVGLREHFTETPLESMVNSMVKSSEDPVDFPTIVIKVEVGEPHDGQRTRTAAPEDFFSWGAVGFFWPWKNGCLGRHGDIMG